MKEMLYSYKEYTESTMRKVIDYCRHIEKETKGLGVVAFNEIVESSFDDQPEAKKMIVKAIENYNEEYTIKSI